MKYLIFGAASTLGQSLIGQLQDRGDLVCGVLHRKANSNLIPAQYIENCNICNISSMQVVLDEIQEHFGSPDHIINCAGKSTYHNFIEDDLDVWYDTFNVNFSGSVNVSHYAAKMLSKNVHGGSIVLVGSGYGVRHIPFLSSYCVSKGALSALVRTLSTELAMEGIRINLVTPGIFPSNMTAQFLANENYTQQLVKHIPDHQFGTPEALAKIILFLTSEEAKHINGAELVVDGGMLNLIEGGIVR